MSLRTAPTEPDIEVEIVRVARDRIALARQEIQQQFDTLQAPGTMLTSSAIEIFARRWREEYRELEQRVYAAELDPSAAAATQELRTLLVRLTSDIDGKLDALRSSAGVGPVAETPADEKARRRAERQARMARFQRGEKP